MVSSGVSLRLRRLQGSGGRYLFVAMDHGLPAGPIAGLERPGDLLRRLRGGPATGAIVNPGVAGRVPRDSMSLPLVVHLSAGTVLGSEPSSKVLSSTVESAVGLGADAVSVQISLGARSADSMVASAGTVVDEASRLGIPVLAMAYGLSAPGTPSLDAEASAHAARAAAELGASLVQTSYGGPAEGLREIVAGCPAPILVSGGPRASSPDVWLAWVREAMAAGAAGLTAGRNLFQAPDPEAFAARIGAAVFGSAPIRTLPG